MHPFKLQVFQIIKIQFSSVLQKTLSLNASNNNYEIIQNANDNAAVISYDTSHLFLMMSQLFVLSQIFIMMLHIFLITSQLLFDVTFFMSHLFFDVTLIYYDVTLIYRYCYATTISYDVTHMSYNYCDFITGLRTVRFLVQWKRASAELLLFLMECVAHPNTKTLGKFSSLLQRWIACGMVSKRHFTNVNLYEWVSRFGGIW